MEEIKRGKLKYGSKDVPEKIFRQIRAKTDRYFALTRSSKNANRLLGIKIGVLILIIGLAYFTLLHSTSFAQLLISYTFFAGAFLILGINIGHDAAHHCFTGNKKTDDFFFQLIFGLQGLCGYFWQKRHNQAHHVYPNIPDHDSDLEMTGLLLLNPNQKTRFFHKYQHLYAPFLYMLFSLVWIFYQDFEMFFIKDQANLKFEVIPVVEWVKLFVIKISYIIIFLVLPFHFSPLPIQTLLIAYFLMNFILSLFLAFTFFISHHVLETVYSSPDKEKNIMNNSWFCHQIITTVDFNEESQMANFIFGGFNNHVAHHLFPEISHIHYPVITRIIKKTLKENKLDWYKSFSFFYGVQSHLRHLKLTARTIITQLAN
ncbi:MAG: fatty acid desaturase [Daejeonella sp.]|nr:fatty acid desaturase [Daejeonella sp.]